MREEEVLDEKVLDEVLNDALEKVLDEVLNNAMEEGVFAFILAKADSNKDGENEVD